MVNPYQQSQYENNNHISLGSYQYKGNEVNGFNRGYNFEHHLNHFGYYGEDLYQYGSNVIYSQAGYTGTTEAT